MKRGDFGDCGCPTRPAFASELNVAPLYEESGRGRLRDLVLFNSSPDLVLLVSDGGGGGRTGSGSDMVAVKMGAALDNVRPFDAM